MEESAILGNLIYSGPLNGRNFCPENVELSDVVLDIGPALVILIAAAVSEIRNCILRADDHMMSGG